MNLCKTCGTICPFDDERTECDAYAPMTNENWFISLPTEEKAEFFHGIVIRAMQATWDGKKPDYPAYLSDWKEWLKQPHQEE